MRAFHLSRTVQNKRTSFVAGLVVAIGLVVSGGGIAVHKVAAADCDSNAIIYCGVTSASNFISKVRANDSGNGHHDLQAVYAHYGLSSADYDRFASSAVSGTAYRDGRIVVDDQTVATGGKSIGREASMQGSGYFSQKIGINTYYGNTNAQAFAAGNDSIPVYVLFNSQGTMEFAVLKSCANPEFGTPVPTSASCNVLNAAPVTNQPTSYNFSAKTNLQGNAKIVKYVYNFGDGTSKTVTSSFTQTVNHNYTQAGTYKVTVTQYVSVPGNGNLQLAVTSMCLKTITIVLPYYSCSSLSGAILDKSNYSYSFTANASYGNGATFTSADYTFGDGTVANGVKPTTSKTATINHTYARAGNYNIAALLHFTVNGQSVSAAHNCTASVTPVTPPTPTCKPGVAVGSPECSAPCTEGSSVPPGSPECTPPCTEGSTSTPGSSECTPPATTTSLPNTGAGNTIAIFAAVVIGGFLIYRQLLFRKHKTAFAAAERGTSALPLGDPLNDEAPLAGTPLQPKHRSFRRKRPF